MAKSRKSRRLSAGGNGSSSSSARGGSRASSADTLLKADHRNVTALFRQFEGASGARKREVARRICHELILHGSLEEEVFYPACRDKGVEDDLLNEAQVEHDSMKLLIADVLGGDPGDEFFDAKIKVLVEYVKHHVKEEEKQGSGIFVKARKAGVDMQELGNRIRERKQQLLQQFEAREFAPPAPRALRLEPGAFNRNREEMLMPRFSDRDRDERGRFMDEDDDRGFRRGSFRGRQDDDDERGGRGGSRGRGQGGWFGDSEGHSRAAQQRGSSSGRYDDDDDNGGRSGSRGGFDRERDDQGRFMSDDDENFGRGRGSRGGFDRERDDQGRFMSDDENGGRGGRSGGGRGWFGDSEGHSRAAQQRGSSSGRYDDDDDNGGRSGGRGGRLDRERDDQGRFMSDDNDDRGGRGGRSGGGRGQGGWFGDSRGHSEASRRGWRDRD